MKRILVGGLLLVLLLAGCGSSVQPLQPMPKSEDQVRQASGDFVTAEPAKTERDFSDAPAGTWIYPGKVGVSNLFPGARAEETLSIHNGGANASTFLVYYEGVPGKPVSEEVGGWLKVSEVAPVLEPDEIRDVLVVLEVPEDAVVDVESFEFLVIVSEADQEGNIQVRNACKWSVAMR